MSIGYKSPTGGWGGESPIAAEDAARKQRNKERMEADARREENLARYKEELEQAREQAAAAGHPETGDHCVVTGGPWKDFTGIVEEIHDTGEATVRLDEPFMGHKEVKMDLRYLAKT